MADKTIQCQLITPDACLLESSLAYASIPAHDGLMGFLPNRAPILMKLGVGELMLRFADSEGRSGGDRSYFVEDGFAQMVDNRLTILARKAIPAEQLTITESEAEVKEAQARQVPADAKDRTADLLKIQKHRRSANAKLAVARSFKARGGGI